MYMPTRNVYVSDSDVSLFSEAGIIAGSLSAAIVEALRDYVNKHHRLADGFQEVELKLSTDGVDRRVTFAGRRVVHLRRPDPEGTRIDTGLPHGQRPAGGGNEGSQDAAGMVQPGGYVVRPQDVES